MNAYERSLRWLYALEAAKGMDFKIERVALALRQLGNPHRKFVSVHVAGTNGKGSVAAIVHEVLKFAGHRVGLYVSPHLVRFTERICVSGCEISEAEVVELVAEIQRVATSRGIGLTFFEFTTVLAFLHFARCGVEVAVVEVGLGGRLDATNVLDPTVSVITTIGRDHVEFLGDSLASIAAEKGGVIKPGTPVVLGRLGNDAANVLRARAAECGAPVLEAGLDYAWHEEPQPRFEGPGWGLDKVRIGLPGAFQHDNAATALATLGVLRDQFPVADEAFRRGLAEVRWPGRCEIVAAAPLTILDGAHNAAGMAALVSEINRLRGKRPVHALFAVMQNKDWFRMVDLLGPLCASVIVTEVLPPRGEAAGPVAVRFSQYCASEAERDPVRAWHKLTSRATAGDIVLAAGSLFLVGAVYPYRYAGDRGGERPMREWLQP